ncbi:copper resistance CopC/CopD family protein [Streptomyces prunicolor]|uniref:copper resistance CopC/CopD family protein n=1 Tax=Streptomyces prunicolor TaxID=67348 RepID=UPI000375093F|nr:copper resistance protein CopC [Streptomyces prunicolor]
MKTTITPRVRNLVLLLLAVTGMLFAGAGTASAHAALTGSDPSSGVVVDKAPTQISLTFSEKVATNNDSLRVLDPKGKRVDVGKPSNVSGTTYAIQVRSGLPDGTYTVAWQVVSADSHPVAGAFTFSVGAPSKTTVSVSDQDVGGGLVGGLYGFGRYMSYAGFIVMVGGAAFILACWQRGAGVRALQRLVVSGWFSLTAATLWLLLLRGSYTTSGKFGDIFDLNLLGQVLQTKTGAALVSRLLLLAAAALFIAVLFGAYARPSPTTTLPDGASRRLPDSSEDEEKRDLTFGLAIGGGVVASGLAASWALAEHASTGLQPGIAMPVDVVHLLAVAIWLGGLSALLVALYRAPADNLVGRTAVQNFSRIAFGSVLALVATGIYQSWRQLGSWSAFTDTGYGQLLLVKIGLVALLVGIASISRRWTARLAETAEASATVVEERAPEKEKAHASASTKTADSNATTSAAASASSATTAAKAGVADATASAEADSEVAASTKGADSEGPGDSKRATQLARQQTAVDTARQKRLRDADPIRFGLRRSVLAEAAVAVVVLAVTTALTTTEPGRTEEDAKAAKASSSSAATSSSGALTLDMSFDTGGTDGKGVIRLDLDPARVGGNEMHVYVQRPNGRAFDVPEVKVAFTLAAKKIGPLPVTPDRIATGHWAANGIQIPMAGDWKISVTVRTSDIDQTTVDKNAQIG